MQVILIVSNATLLSLASGDGSFPTSPLSFKKNLRTTIHRAEYIEEYSARSFENAAGPQHCLIIVLVMMGVGGIKV